ncbi:hypothetical protein EV644_101332 [Kribbella orskensis]|uniref:Uncharacterized protein n=1 Tax=Kribbella orskensis TaxID=2512216 RepID=A0ABY2BTZ5_9ACTN|nr:MULTISPECIES: hypothetical protein [Kribbella]TCN44532.1 hypothetical protein EV642_101657 [Kribbella sp. VKM Ac-2500]TCO31690.1 hypothetical protein EV644_101332 [Kribbella orskensis]
MIISFGMAGVWFVLFLVSFLRDQRLLRNGVYLVLTLLFAGLGVVFALEKVSESAAKVLVVAVLVHPAEHRRAGGVPDRQRRGHAAA